MWERGNISSNLDCCSSICRGDEVFPKPALQSAASVKGSCDVGKQRCAEVTGVNKAVQSFLSRIPPSVDAVFLSQKDRKETGVKPAAWTAVLSCRFPRSE